MGLMKSIKEKSRDKKVKRKINPTIVIVCEGKNTEPEYFNLFKTRYVNVNVEIPDKKSCGKNKGKKTDPLSLVMKAEEYKRSKYEIREQDGDRVWCVFDVDLNYNTDNAIQARIVEINKAKIIADSNKIKLGISNPCFELWYLIHFEYTTANLKDCNSVIERLNKYIIDYNKSKCPIRQDENYKKLMTTAISNAKKLKEHHQSLKTMIHIENLDMSIKDLVESNPYTNLWELIGYMENIEGN
jgi:hypothetical protein